MTFRHLTRMLAVLAAAAAVAAIAPPRSPAATAASADPVVIRVSGSWAPYQQVLTWQNALASAPSPTDFGYTPHGTLLGRQDFVAGRTDAVFSALPFSDAELEGYDGGRDAIIDAPVHVASLAFIVRKPLQGLVEQTLACDPDDPEVVDPTACFVSKPYTGPLRLPSPMLGGALLAYQGDPALPVPITSWNSPAVLESFGVANLSTVPVLAGPSAIARSDADETNYFMQQYVKQVAPDVWQAKRDADPAVPWEPITERCPCGFSGGSRDGVNAQVAVLSLANDPITGGFNSFKAGLIAPAPASALGNLRKIAPDAPVADAEIRNQHGDWLSPTPESITKAAAAGGLEANYALTHDVPGAYPLVWIDHLYVPAKGLSIAKTEALATTIRYLATTGQKAAAPAGEGALPPALVKQSLAAADMVVEGNCTGGDAVIVKSNDPGPDAPPDAAEMKTIGVMSHCQSTAAGGEGFNAGGFVPSDYSSAPLDYGSTSTAAPIAAGVTSATPGSVGATRRTTEGVLIAKRLPLPMPTSSGVDRLATLALGAALFLLLRKPVTRLLQGVRT